MTATRNTDDKIQDPTSEPVARSGKERATDDRPVKARETRAHRTDGYLETDRDEGREFNEDTAEAIAEWTGSELLFASDMIEGRRPYLSLDCGDGIVLEVNVGDRVVENGDGWDVIRNPVIVHERDENTHHGTEPLSDEEREAVERRMGEDEAARKAHEVGARAADLQENSKPKRK